MFCKQCGKEIPENSNFCTWCGASQAAAQPGGETVIEPVPQADGPAPKAQEPAPEPELVVEPGPAPEAPPAPELVFDLPAPEAGPAPRADEPAPMPLPEPVAEPASKADEPAPMPLPDPVPGPAGGPAGGPPPVPPTPAQPAGAANASGGVSYDLLLKIFALICATFAAIAALKQLPDMVSNSFAALFHDQFAYILYVPESLIAIAGYLLMVLVLILLAFFRTEANTDALCSGLLAGVVVAAAACLLRFCVSLLVGALGSFWFLFSVGTIILSLIWSIFWLAVCLAGVWGILYLMKSAPDLRGLIKDLPDKYRIIVETIKGMIAATKN